LGLEACGNSLPFAHRDAPARRHVIWRGGTSAETAIITRGRRASSTGAPAASGTRLTHLGDQA
jgi:hypothetical protein